MVEKKDELKDRVEARKLELQAKFAELKADTRAEVRDTRDFVERKLNELSTHLQHGWDKANDSVREKLNNWLKEEPKTKAAPKP